MELKVGYPAKERFPFASPALLLAEPSLLLAKPALLFAEPSSLFTIGGRGIDGAVAEEGSKGKMKRRVRLEKWRDGRERLGSEKVEIARNCGIQSKRERGRH